MEIGMFNDDLQRITLEDKVKSRIVQTVLKSKLSSNMALPRKRHVPQPALLVGLLVVMVAASALFLLLPGIKDQFSRSGCPPEFSDRYFSLIEIDGSAYIYQGNGTLYRLDAVSPLTKIGRLNAGNLLSDGSDFFYAKSNKVYQAELDLSGRTRVLREQEPIEVDYVTRDIILYHFGNHNRYTLFDRQTGEMRQLFPNSEEKNYTYQAGSGIMAVFVHTGKEYAEKLYAVNLTDGSKIELFDGSIRDRAVIINGDVYFLLTGEPVDQTYSHARELWSVRLDGKSLMKHDLSSISFKSIQTIAGSGQELIIATNENIQRHQGKIYLYQPGIGLFMLLQDSIGLIDRLFATEQYYSYYDLGIGDTSGQAFAGLIVRDDGQ